MSNTFCVCIASGPSLTREDAELVRKSGAFTIAVNSSWQAAHWANIIYAGDLAWWEANHKIINSHAQRYTSTSNIAEQFGIHYLRNRPRGMSNSGADAIRLAAEMGFKQVLLLGYDCALKNGTHWHGDHTQTKNPTPALVSGWRNHFDSVSRDLDIEIINCSRYTTLDFERATLEDALCLSRE